MALCLHGCRPSDTTSASARTKGPVYIVGLSPFLGDDCKDDVYRRVTRLLLEGMPLNSSLHIYDAYHLRTIARADVPALGAFRSGKTRANQFKDQINALKRFLAAQHTPPASAGDVDWAGAVRLPQWLEFISDHLDHSSARVLVLGSPLYLDAKEPAFSMVNGYYPSDGHLGGSKDQSIFGLKDRTDHLKDVWVGMGYFGDPWVSELHQDKVVRFWSLYVEGQGGVLGSVCNDPATLFAAFAQEKPRAGLAGSYQRDPSSTRIEMLRINREVTLTDWITSDRPDRLRTEAPTRETGPLKIGIRWQGNLDLDLYSRSRPGAILLSFRRTTSPEGYYFKDHRSSPLGEYEFIEFESPVNVRELEAAVNFYEGSCPGGAVGEVRIDFDGGVYVGQFHVAAEHGNQGRSGPGMSDHWAPIDVLRILRIQQ